MVIALKKLINWAENERFHFLQKKEAKAILSQVESYGRKLSPSLKEAANSYAIDVFGSKRYAPWLYVYAAWSQEFKEGWIPDNYYREFVVPQLQGSYGKLSFNNIMGNSLFDTDCFPDLGYYINGQWLSKNDELCTQRQFKEMLFTNNQEVVFKLDYSLKGRGVHFFNKEAFNFDKIKALGNGVFQSKVAQHPFFAGFGATALATIRITTAINTNGKADTRGCYIKFGRAGETHTKGSAQVVVPVELETGRLLQIGHLHDWSAIDHHPDSDLSFNEKYIPNFRKVKSICEQLHQKLPYVHCVGWDAAITENNEFFILEWNGFHNDIKYSEMTQGPCFIDLGWENLWKVT